MSSHGMHAGTAAGASSRAEGAQLSELIGEGGPDARPDTPYATRISATVSQR
jgi:hypothetical protein